MPKLQKETVKKTKIMKKKQISKTTLFSYGSDCINWFNFVYSKAKSALIYSVLDGRLESEI